VGFDAIELGALGRGSTELSVLQQELREMQLQNNRLETELQQMREEVGLGER
jgi:hypothetical protein